MSFLFSQNPSDVNTLLIRQGRDRIMRSLIAIGTHVYESVELFELASAYRSLFDKCLDEFECYHYFGVKHIDYVVNLYLFDFLDFVRPIDKSNPILIVISKAENAFKPVSPLQTNIKFSESGVSNFSADLPRNKTWISSKFLHPSVPPPPRLANNAGPGYTVQHASKPLTIHDRRDDYLPSTSSSDVFSFKEVKKVLPDSETNVPIRGRFTKRITRLPSDIDDNKSIVSTDSKTNVSETSFATTISSEHQSLKIVRKNTYSQKGLSPNSRICNESRDEKLPSFNQTYFIPPSKTEVPRPPEKPLVTNNTSKTEAPMPPFIKKVAPLTPISRQSQAALLRPIPRPKLALNPIESTNVLIRTHNRSPSECSVISDYEMFFPKRHTRINSTSRSNY